MISLLNRYPKPPTEAEIQKANVFEERKKIEEAFQEMFNEDGQFDE